MQPPILALKYISWYIKFVYLRLTSVGQVAQAARRFVGLDVLGSITDGDFPSVLRVQTGPGVQSASRKMSTIAPKLLYGRKICDLAELLTPLAIHTLIYSRK